MPYQARRNSFGATASTVAYWVLIGAVVYFVRPQIPPVVNSRLVGSKSGFIREAAKQHIEWQDMSPDIFAQAKASGKPVFVFIGSEWSELSQEVDDRVLNSVDVAERLNRDFISVRLDAQRQRKWTSCIVQMTRAESGWEPHNQLVFFSPEGKVLRVLDFAPNTRAIDDVRFIKILDEVRFPAADAPSVIDAKTQNSEYQTLVGGYEQAVPNPEAYGQELDKSLNVDHPGLLIGNSLILQARDYAFLIASGRSDTVRGQVHSLLAKSAFCWLDGAFFRSSRDLEWKTISLNLSAGRNADMLEVIGSLNQASADPADLAVADRLFSTLRDRFVADGQFYAAVYSDIGDNRRSPRYSVSSALVRKLFGGDYGRTVELLGLDPRSNPMMIPRAGHWPLEGKSYYEFSERIDRLRAEGKLQDARSAGPSSLDVGARVVTALLRYAALTQNAAYLDDALKAAGQAQIMRSGDTDVRHSIDQDVEEPYLGDYLNFAEMELTLYRVFGDVASLEVGRSVLDRAQFLFSTQTPGVFVNGKFSEYGPMAEQWAVPKLVDDDLPATCAQMADLLRAYASVENDPAVRAAMRGKADLIMKTMAPAANKLSKQLATFNISALMARSDSAVFAVGKDCVQQARGWDWMSSLSWSYPALASVRPDLQARGPGYYYESRGKSEGPMSRAEAAARVRKTDALAASP